MNFLDEYDDFELDEAISAFSASKGWDIAVRYHDLKKRLGPEERRALRTVSVQAILRNAMAFLGSASKPKTTGLAFWPEIPVNAESVELDLEETISESPLLLRGRSAVVAREAMVFRYQKERRFPLIIALDTSLSMTGEKLALTAVALAVVLLQFPDDPLGIIAFENRANVLKLPDEMAPLERVIERFLDVPAQGYTDIEEALKSALKFQSNLRKKQSRSPVTTLLLTDGKYTAGRDPAYLGKKFSHLIVLKLGEERAGADLCNDLASAGGGFVRDVVELRTLPEAMVQVIHRVLRQ